MIVDPDFFDHWKTQMLVDLTKDDSSPLWILRLWSFAQARRTGTFENLPPAAIKAVTKAKGHRAEQIEAWLEEAGFIRRKGLRVVLHEWEEYNRGLLANWKNGALGGRPKKQEENPSETHGIPMDNPNGTHVSIPILSSISESENSEKEREESARKAAISQAWNAGIPEDFATYVFDDWFSREGKDGAGIKTTFPALAKKRWNREQAAWKNGEHKGSKPKGTNGSSPPRKDVIRSTKAEIVGIDGRGTGKFIEIDN